MNEALLLASPLKGPMQKSVSRSRGQWGTQSYVFYPREATLSCWGGMGVNSDKSFMPIDSKMVASA